MRPSLLHPRGASRHSRRQRRAHRSSALETVRELAGGGAVSVAATGKASSETARGGCDPAVQRVREAGGPIDRASYVCECGYLFSAAVSTSVECPHCGADQSW